MICQVCGQHEATTHITRSVNGTVSQLHVCSKCAAKNGLYATDPWNMNSLFGGLLSQPFIKESETPIACEQCGMSYRAVLQEGRVGCPKCYTTFYKQLQPSIQRIHGKTSHVGKIGASGSDSHRIDREIQGLKEELTRAVAAQEYERCADLRDRIRALEEGVK